MVLPELELKLVFAHAASAHEVFALLANDPQFGTFTLRRKASFEFVDEYYDTTGGELRRRGTSLRKRRCGESVCFQMKRRVQVGGDGLQYTTFTFPEEGVLEDKTGCPEALAPLRLLIEFESGRSTTTTVGQIRVRRSSLALLNNGVAIGTLCLDQFDVWTAEAPDSECSGSEVEIHGARNPRLHYFAECLCRWFGMIQVRSSKMERYLEPLVPAATRVILDGDFAGDEMLAAAFLACRPSVRISACTSVGGIVSAQQGAANARRALSWLAGTGVLGALPEIGIGYELSAPPDVPRAVLGQDGLGRFDGSPSVGGGLETDFPDAVELLCRALRRNPGEVTIVATGPLSNLAQLARRYPDALRAARAVVIAGGAFFGERGGEGRTEFNMRCDSEAARAIVEYCRRPVVQEDGSLYEAVPLVFVSRDTSRYHFMSASTLSRIEGPLRPGLQDALGPFVEYYEDSEGLPGMPVGALLGAISAIAPRLLIRERYHVEVVVSPEVPDADGLTIADFGPFSSNGDQIRRLTWVTVATNGAAVDAEVVRTFGRRM